MRRSPYLAYLGPCLSTAFGPFVCWCQCTSMAVVTHTHLHFDRNVNIHNTWQTNAPKEKGLELLQKFNLAINPRPKNKNV